MKFEIHQTSWINGKLIEVAGDPVVIEIEPLALKGQSIEHWPIDQDAPEYRKLTEDMQHVPGPHWKPLDDEAKALCAKHGHKFTGQVPDVLAGLQRKLAEAEATKLHKDSAEQIGAGIAKALIEAGVIQAPKAADSVRPEPPRLAPAPRR